MSNHNNTARCVTRFYFWLRILLRILIGGIFIYAAWEKILAPGVFTNAVCNYRLVPQVLLHSVALIVPPLELICGILFITGRWPAATAWLVLLSGAFVVIQVQALGRGLDIQCGCFGAEAHSPLTIGKLFTNIVLLAILIGFWFRDVRTAKKRMVHAS